jgi:hypothetical protein
LHATSIDGPSLGSTILRASWLAASY